MKPPVSLLPFLVSLFLLPVLLVPGLLFAQAPNPVPALLENLQSDTDRIAASAARSLGVIFSPGGRGGDEFEPVASAIGEKLDSKSSLIRRQAAVSLGTMRAKSALEALKETVKDKDYTVATAAANAIAEILPRADARAFLREIAGEPEESVQVAATDALAAIAGSEDADFFIGAMSNRNWRIATQAIRGLERSVNAGARPEPAVYDRVAGLLGSEVKNTADAALHFLTHVRNDESRRATVAATNVRGDGSKSDQTWRTRTYALRVFRHTRDVRALPAVVRQLGDPTANVVNEARLILQDMKERKQINHHSLFPILLTEFEAADNPRLQSGIMAEMGNHIPDQYHSRLARVASDCLAKSVGDKKAWEARQRSIYLLGRCEYTGAMSNIAACVNDDVPNVRQAAGSALGNLARHCNDEQRASVAPVLLPLLDDTRDWRKSAIAARNAGYYAGPEAIAPLVKLLSHGVVNVKDGAAYSLSNLAQHEDEDTRAQVQKLLLPELKSTDLSWEYGVRVLGALKKVENIGMVTAILTKGTWRAKEQGAIAAASIASANEVEDAALNAALIRNAQSDIVQVQERSNAALRALAK